MANNQTDFTEQNINNRTERIFTAFIEYIEQNNLILHD